VAVGDERRRQPAADEPGGSGDQRAHWRFIPQPASS
jgi:hypothetical protein